MTLFQIKDKDNFFKNNCRIFSKIEYQIGSTKKIIEWSNMWDQIIYSFCTKKRARFVILVYIFSKILQKNFKIWGKIFFSINWINWSNLWSVEVRFVIYLWIGHIVNIVVLGYFNQIFLNRQFWWGLNAHFVH